MTSTVVYARYARSLVDVVMERRAESEVNRSLELYRAIFAAVPELLTAFDNPALPRDVKGRLLADLLQKYPVDPTTDNFLHILLANNRIRHFREIVEYYTRALNDRKGILAAKVTSASALSDEEARVLAGKLTHALGKAVTMDMVTDPDLLGGLVVQIGSTVYDGSIRKQLDEVRKRLLEPTVKV
jgi:F-type H+-transporting ATPase subunit delta